ncbi:5-deoxy-glucuronate isomerase [Sphingomonas sp.]|uniref:5-deoxy-glucuronate isomerase n=1 Tax=Sphingomonas sp. TaxID=28214 RepID=UPI002DD6882E|nr:5-deoxy-glucuronate isomerase [Sphingomonas sp.]
MSLLVHPHPPDARGVTIDITPESAGWAHVGFRVVRLAAGERHAGRETGREACLVLLSGRADVTAGGERFSGIGGREDIFAASPTSLYLPADTDYAVTAIDAVELAVCTAPAAPGGAVRLIAPEEVGEEMRGRDTNTRYVRNILPDTSDIAQSLLVVEVITPGGNWSSYPPHKHDVDAWPVETLLEETYYHRMKRPGGFAFQRVYTDDRSLDETMAVGDGDAVLVPRGYHPVGAAHGYDLYYLNVMAGPRRAWKFTNDPAHDWIVRQ